MSRDEIGAVERAFRVFAYLSKQDAGLSELARHLGVAKSAALRLLSTLERNGAVIQQPDTKNYRLGPRLLELGSTYLRGLGVRRVALPYMQTLWRQTGETVTLLALIGHEAVCIESLDSPHELRLASEVGSVSPLTKGAIGKVLLAYADPAVQDGVLQGAGADSAAVRRELSSIVEAGAWITVGERVAGLWAAAAPITDHSGRTVAALSVRGPALRFAPDTILAEVDSLRVAVAGISRHLGAPPQGETSKKAEAIIRRRVQIVSRQCRRYGAP